MLGGEADRRRHGGGKVAEWLRFALLLAVAYALYSSHSALRAGLDAHGKALGALSASAAKADAADVPAAVRELGAVLGRVEQAAHAQHNLLTTVHADEIAHAAEGRLSDAVRGARAELSELALHVSRAHEQTAGALREGQRASEDAIGRLTAALDAHASRLDRLEPVLTRAGGMAPAVGARAQPPSHSPTPAGNVDGAAAKDAIAARAATAAAGAAGSSTAGGVEPPGGTAGALADEDDGVEEDTGAAGIVESTAAAVRQAAPALSDDIGTGAPGSAGDTGEVIAAAQPAAAAGEADDEVVDDEGVAHQAASDGDADGAAAKARGGSSRMRGMFGASAAAARAAAGAVEAPV
ncbi:hypothetical protein KFE25_003195 [Diacronema lutheri]|uniref:Uncharacterized protein n=2 Tax=Diacronema lutheri TaxID=2081491 RepID=A0A8J6C9T4_DIALT|nr:hypothetical protein KFE25_003195 [Diacronema lutheri]